MRSSKYRCAMTDYKQEDWLVNLPLWALPAIQTQI